MQSRRDQVVAHQFLVSRLTSGLLRADPDVVEPPTRRTNRGMTYGLVIAGVVSAGFLVFGLVKPGGNTTWQSGKALIVEKETGTRYVYDGRLHTVLNYPSARLLLGADMSTVSVSANSLGSARHGTEVGIPGAPDSLPTQDNLNAHPWQVCAATTATDSGAHKPLTVLAVDAEPDGSGVRTDQAVLVAGPDGDTYLLWQDNRFKVAGGKTALAALGYGGVSPTTVSAAFLDAVPAGPDLAAPPVTGLGGSGPKLDGQPTRVGQVFTVETPGSAKRYYVLGEDGLTPITPTQAALALSDPDTKQKAYQGGAPKELVLSPQALSGALAPTGSATGSAVRQAGAQLPSAPPTLLSVPGSAGVCVGLDPQGTKSIKVTLSLVPAKTVIEEALPPLKALAPACLPVDGIAVAPGSGSLVHALSSSGNGTGTTTYLVTDNGVKYRVPTADAAKDLGYDLSAAEGLPASLLNMLPTGPDLSPEAAASGRAAVTGTPVCGSGNKQAPKTGSSSTS
ncbi:type VII secretion protein EccB [Streptomyces sp. MC1]|uniref:type VII secretion protein EccB n=1 Tax=Streptomyces sp. MC1 TaxID=295105 RepID=UPI0018CB97B8|nr:type VII secretion protein EccB [Streptomyces sp. MC1]MBG7700132.1 type VII secretion protein EccB [Streptomyces sp. MC1]